MTWPRAGRWSDQLQDGARMVRRWARAGGFLSPGSGLSPGLRTTLFSLGTAIILAACLVAIARRRSLTISVLGLTLVVAGGLSNLADRVARGFVVDFLNVGVGPVRTGIFNVADVAIMTGIALTLLRARRVRAFERVPSDKP
jgi:signal peptidase II